MDGSIEKTILLVEDEPIIALDEKAALEKFGYRVIWASDGEKAITSFAGNPDIDLVLMDINLGKGIDGTEAARLILAEHDVPIVFLSSHIEPEIVEKTERITSYGYVVKASSKTVLDALIKMAFKLFDANRTMRAKMDVLKASDDRFHMAMNEFDGTLWTVDRNLRFTLSQGQALASLGLLPDQVVGMRLTDFLQSEDPRNESLDAHRRALLGECVQFAYSHQGRTFRTAVSPMKDTSGDIIGVVGIGTDITERKRSEQALRESEGKFHRVFDASPYPMMIIDTDNGDFNEVNEAMVRDLEYSREELIGANVTRLGIIGPDAETRTRDLVMKNGGYRDLEIVVTAKSGKRRFGLATGQVIEIGGHYYIFQTIIDLTERKLVEKALRDSEFKYRSLIEYSSNIVFCVDRRGEYLFANKAFARAFGKDPDWFVGKTFWDVYPKENADRRMEIIGKVFRSGEKESFEISVPIEGRTLFYSSTANPVKDDSGEVVMVLAHGTDITTRKLAEEKVTDLLAEKELILKEVHHRIKNNMSTMMSLLSLQANNMKESSAVAAIRDAERRFRSMEVLYDKLYRAEDFSRIPAGEYLPTLAREIVDSYPNSAAVRLETDIADFILAADTISPLGILMNEIIANAMKYAFAGRDKGLIRVSATEKGSTISISVEDDGIGLPDSIGFSDSSGFGLLLVKSLADQLDGTIRIDRGKGTRFSLEFENR